MEPTPEQIKNALEQSGYLFEQKVASVLEQLDFVTTTNKVYSDPGEKKSREIDVFGYRQVYESARPGLKVLCYLNCESKNSINPYVFIMRRKGILDDFYKPDGIFLAQPMYLKNQTISVDAFDHMELANHHFATRPTSKAVQLCKIIGNKRKLEAQHDGVLNAILYPLIESKAVWAKQTQEATADFRLCRIFFNIAIINAELYTINADKPEAMPEPANFVPFIYEVSTSSAKGKFLVTFVKFNFLQQFIQEEILPFCSVITGFYANNPELITGNQVK